jgi:hypothetical protein
VLLLAFVPVLIAGGWIVVALEPHSNWFRDHVLAWSGDIHIRSFVRDMSEYVSVIAFAIGLTFGFTFDTAGPRREAVGVPATVATDDGVAADEPVARERRGFLRRRDKVPAE